MKDSPWVTHNKQKILKFTSEFFVFSIKEKAAAEIGCRRSCSRGSFKPRSLEWVAVTCRLNSLRPPMSASMCGGEELNNSVTSPDTYYAQRHFTVKCGAPSPKTRDTSHLRDQWSHRVTAHLTVHIYVAVRARRASWYVDFCILRYGKRTSGL